MNGLTVVRPLGLALLMIVAVPNEGKAEPTPPEDLARIRARIDHLLRDELTRPWYPRAVDQTHGGFHQNFGRDWSPQAEDNRFLVYQARMTWTAAAFAEFPGAPREAFLDYARHGVAYLDRVFRDREGGGFHFIVGLDGQPDPRLGTDQHVYATAFALFAASRAHQASGDESARKLALDVFDWLERHAHDDQHGGYFEAFDRSGKPLIAYAPSLPIAQRTDRLGVYRGFKSMNSHIHLLEAIAELYRIQKTEAVAARLRELLSIVRDRIAVEPGALNLYFTRDWRPVPAHDSFGHDVETAYLLLEAAEVLGIPDDEATARVAKSLVDHALDWGWDAKHGGFYDKGEAFNGQAFDTKKVWWTQAEGLNALLLMDRKHGKKDSRYRDAFLKQWEFIDRHLIDPEHGGWYEETTREGDRIGDGRKAQQWKANYHAARAMMNVVTMLDEIIHEPR